MNICQETKESLDNYVKYLDTTCAIAKIDKVQVIEMVKNKRQQEDSITNLLD